MQDNKVELTGDLSHTIKQMRLHRGLSQEALAELSNTSLKTIQRLENGKVQPRPHTLLCVAEGLSTTIDELVCFEREERSEHRDSDYDGLAKVNFSCLLGLLLPPLHIILPVVMLMRLTLGPEARELARRLISVQLLFTLGTILLLFLRPIISKVIFGSTVIGNFPTSMTMFLIILLFDGLFILKVAFRLSHKEISFDAPIPAILGLKSQK